MEKEVFIYHCNNHTDLFGNHRSLAERKQLKTHSYTCAVDLVELDFLLSFTDILTNAVKRGEDMPINLGVALCHVDDCYNKKVGAHLATERMEPQKAKIELFQTYRAGDHWVQIVHFFFPETGLHMQVKQESLRRRPKVDFDW